MDSVQTANITMDLKNVGMKTRVIENTTSYQNQVRKHTYCSGDLIRDL